jgi:general secretion pathway protein G
MRITPMKFKDSVTSRLSPRKPLAEGIVPHGEAGLTLIEMMIVIVIIAVLASAVVLSGILNRPDQARATTAKTDIASISSALKLYRMDNGDYPTAEQGLKALVVAPSPTPPGWLHPYVEQDPKDPWGRDYVYTVDGGSFTITSLGKDGKPGGEGVDADITGKGS